MKHNILLIGLVVSMQLCVVTGAKAERASMQEFAAQADGASVLSSAVLQNMAFAAYEVLIEVPFSGVEKRLPELQQLLSLKQALERSSGLRERLLAVTITEGINRLLLFEVVRRASAMRGQIVPPPFQVGSFQPDTVKTLFQQNRIDEREAIAYIRELNGKFATFCKSKNFSLEDFLTGHVASAFSREWRTMLGQRIALWQSSVERSTLEDLLFGLLLTVVDGAKDVEILYDIYVTVSPDPEKKFELEKELQQRLDEASFIRLSLGGDTSPQHIYRTLQMYLGKGQKYWAFKLTENFVPFFQETDEHLKFIQKMFVQYELDGRNIGNLPPFGAWFESVE